MQTPWFADNQWANQESWTDVSLQEKGFFSFHRLLLSGLRGFNPSTRSGSNLTLWESLSLQLINLRIRWTSVRQRAPRRQWEKKSWLCNSPWTCLLCVQTSKIQIRYLDWQRSKADELGLFDQSIPRMLSWQRCEWYRSFIDHGAILGPC